MDANDFCCNAVMHCETIKYINKLKSCASRNNNNLIGGCAVRKLAKCSQP